MRFKSYQSQLNRCGRPRPLPTTSEIAERAAEIRAGWTPKTEWERRVQRAEPVSIDHHVPREPRDTT